MYKHLALISHFYCFSIHGKITQAAHLPIAVNSVEHLTRRELQVLKLAARGLGNRDIAVQLGIGTRTVKHHLMNIFNKMSVRSRTEAVLKAIRHGWVSSEGD